MTQARGEYIAILDDDDYWAVPGQTDQANRISSIQNPEFCCCGGGVIVVDPAGREQMRYLKLEKNDGIKRKP